MLMQPSSNLLTTVNNTKLLIKFLASFLLPCFLGLMGHLGLMMVVDQVEADMFEMVQGPFGALAILLAGVIILGRFIYKLIDRNDKLRDKIEQMYKDRIEELKKD